jgi:hypothetical protein
MAAYILEPAMVGSAEASTGVAELLRRRGPLAPTNFIENVAQKEFEQLAPMPRHDRVSRRWCAPLDAILGFGFRNRDRYEPRSPGHVRFGLEPTARREEDFAAADFRHRTAALGVLVPKGP